MSFYDNKGWPGEYLPDAKQYRDMRIPVKQKIPNLKSFVIKIIPSCVILCSNYQDIKYTLFSVIIYTRLNSREYSDDRTDDKERARYRGF